MQYTSARKTSVSTPCTNVPIHCPFCPPHAPSGEPQTIWKYNAVTHLYLHHQDEDGLLPKLPPQFLVDMHVSKAEESTMGIAPDWTEKWRDENAVPDSDGIEAPQEESAADSMMQKRARAQSTAEVERRRKTAKTR